MLWIISIIIHTAMNTTWGSNHRSQNPTYDGYSSLYSDHFHCVPYTCTEGPAQWERLLPLLCVRVTALAVQIPAQVCSLVSDDPRPLLRLQTSHGGSGGVNVFVHREPKGINHTMCAVPGWGRSYIWTRGAQPSAKMSTLQGSILKRDKRRYFEKRVGFFSFLQRLYFVTEDRWKKRQNKTKIQFLK